MTHKFIEQSEFRITTVYILLYLIKVEVYSLVFAWGCTSNEVTNLSIISTGLHRMIQNDESAT